MYQHEEINKSLKRETLNVYTPSPPTKSLGFRGFDSSRL